MGKCSYFGYIMLCGRPDILLDRASQLVAKDNQQRLRECSRGSKREEDV